MKNAMTITDEDIKSLGSKEVEMHVYEIALGRKKEWPEKDLSQEQARWMCSAQFNAREAEDDKIRAFRLQEVILIREQDDRHDVLVNFCDIALRKFPCWHSSTNTYQKAREFVMNLITETK